MCGRFTLQMPWAEVNRLYSLPFEQDRGRNTEPRYNIAPTQQVMFICLDEECRQVTREGRWWLVPYWARELPRQTMFNARIETVATSNAFKDSFRSKRCLIPAD